MITKLTTDEAQAVQAIGAEIMAMVGAPPPRALIYSEVEDGVVGTDIFVEIGTEVKYLEPTSEINHIVHDLWQARFRLGEHEPWAAMTYFLVGNEFKLDFIYREHLDVGKSAFDRRKAALTRIMGPVNIIWS